MVKDFSEFGGNPVIEDNAEPTPTDIAWLAGVFDGEGSLIMGAKVDRYLPTLGFHLVNTDLLLLGKCQMILQSIIKRPVTLSSPKKIYQSAVVKSRKQCFSINLRKQSELLKILTLLRPHLTSKARKADLILAYLEHRLKIGNKTRCTYKIDPVTQRLTDDIMKNWRGVETEREALGYFIKMKPQSELTSNGKSDSEMKSPCSN